MAKVTQDLSCPAKIKAIRDALEVIQGKWRIPIIISLTHGNKRFGLIKQDIGDISPKMLAQELKRLESSLLISKTLLDPNTANFEYELTSLGQSLSNLLDELLAWGSHFRTEVIRKG